MHVRAVSVEARRGFGSPGVGVTAAVCWEQNLGPLQEKQELLTTKLPTQVLLRRLEATKSGRVESSRQTAQEQGWRDAQPLRVLPEPDDMRSIPRSHTVEGRK